MPTNASQRIFPTLFLIWLFLIWFLFIYFSYLYFHNQLFLFVFAAFLTAVLFSFLFSCKNIFVKWFPKKVKLSSIILLFFVFGILSSPFLFFFINQGWDAFLPTWTSFLLLYLQRTAFLASLVLLSASLGRRILSYFSIFFSDYFEELLIAFGVGFGMMLIIFFLFGVLGWLYFLPIFLLIISLAIFLFPQEKYFIKQFIHTEVVFFTESKKQFLNFFLLFLLFTFLLFTYIQSFILYPYDYDSLVAYFSTPELYAGYHRIVPIPNHPASMAGGIVMSFYAGLNVSLGYLYPLMLSWLFLLGILVLLYLFTVKFFSKRYALLSVFLASAVPWNIHFVSTQKVIFIFAFFSMLSVYAIFSWLKTRERHWFFLSAVFLGMSVSIKMKGLFLVFSLFVLLGLFIFQKKLSCG